MNASPLLRFLLVGFLLPAICLANPANQTFQDDFENRGPGLLNATPGLWTIGGGGTLTLKEGIGANGSRALEILTGAGESSEIAYSHAPLFETVLWTDFQARLAPHSDGAPPPSVPTESSVAFHLTESGDVRARDGGEWISLNQSLDPGQLHRFSFKQDYPAQQWSLWINGNLVTASPLAFANPQPAPDRFRIVQDPQHSSVVDEVRVTRTAPSGLSGVRDYGLWSGTISWNGADSSITADPNANRLSNLLEYGFGFSQPADGTHTYTTGLDFDGNEALLSLTYRRNRQAEDLLYLIQTSGDLVEWSEIFPTPTQVTVQPIDNETDAVTVAIPVSEESLFLRLQVIQP